MQDEAERDRERIEGLKAGKRDALVALYQRYGPTMLGLALRILRNRADAEDLVHDVFIEAWQKADAYDPSRGRVRTWLLMRTRARAIDRLRSLALARRKGALHRPTDFANHAEELPDHCRTRHAVAGLSEAQRVVIELGYFEGLSCREIAERCDLPLGTVKSRLATAMVRLRTSLGVVSGRGGEVSR